MFKPMNNVSKTKYDYIDTNDIKDMRSKLIESRKNVLSYLKYNGYTLPATMNLNDWPNVKFMNDGLTAYAFTKKNIKMMRQFYLLL